MIIHDISLPVSSSITVWPGDPSVSLVQTKSISNGDACNLTMLTMGVHSGTHIDAPSHFLQNGDTIDMIPIKTLIGPCVVVEVDSETLFINKEHLPVEQLQGHCRVLFKTRNSKQWRDGVSSFNPNFVALGIDAAQYLLDLKVVLVGIDYLSIESFHAVGNQVHRLLLENNVVILEGVNLSEITPGMYELICLPICLQGSEGAPARVILREKD